MLTDEQLIDEIRSRLQCELSELHPPVGFLDGLGDEVQARAPARGAVRLARARRLGELRSALGVGLAVMVTALVVLVVLAVGGAHRRSSPQVASARARSYTDPAGWTVTVPRGWHVVRFKTSKGEVNSAGVQISNVRLPRPQLVPGAPIQVNGRVLPPNGIGLIIASDNDPGLSHGTVVSPPLPSPNGGAYWSAQGPALLGAYMETLWFRAAGKPFIADIKVGPKPSSAVFNAVARIIRSLRFHTTATVSPMSGPIGTIVHITGSGFDPSLAGRKFILAFNRQLPGDHGCDLIGGMTVLRSQISPQGRLTGEFRVTGQGQCFQEPNRHAQVTPETYPVVVGCMTCQVAVFDVTPGRESRSANGLVPATSQTPAAGVCPTYPGRLVTVLLGFGIPSPRCVRVRADQQLKVINKPAPPYHPVTITVTWPPFGPRTLAPSHGTVFKKDFGSYLATGDHLIYISPKGQGPAEIWLAK